MALLLCVVGILSGCATIESGSSDAKALTVEPAPDAGFIEQPDQQVKRADLPFQKVWIKPGFDMRDYKELIVAPVNTQYMFEMDWLHKASSANWLGGVKRILMNLPNTSMIRRLRISKQIPIISFRSLTHLYNIKNRHCAWNSR
ncbi:hypothetical protein [Methylobacter psychrophilus]|uniref:hypothetical protein n=1 Tax=Methylobacter psychrophilus TaxID=96941 RepID=UPI0021D494B2|nr:hypothetical protein [Methylobacter psychrophilus]